MTRKELLCLMVTKIAIARPDGTMAGYLADALAIESAVVDQVRRTSTDWSKDGVGDGE